MFGKTEDIERSATAPILGRKKSCQEDQPKAAMALVSHQAMYKPAALDHHPATSTANGAFKTSASAKNANSNGTANHNGKINGCTNGNPGTLMAGLVATNTSVAAANACAASNAILAAAQPYCHAPIPPQEFQPDRPIGYGAFGVVW